MVWTNRDDGVPALVHRLHHGRLDLDGEPEDVAELVRRLHAAEHGRRKDVRDARAAQTLGGGTRLVAAARGDGRVADMQGAQERQLLQREREGLRVCTHEWDWVSSRNRDNARCVQMGTGQTWKKPGGQRDGSDWMTVCQLGKTLSRRSAWRDRYT